MNDTILSKSIKKERFLHSQLRTSVGYTYNLEKIRKASIVEKNNENGTSYSLLRVVNDDDAEFFS